MPTTTSNAERSSIASSRPELSNPHVSTIKPDAFRSRFAVTYFGKYLGFGDDMALRLYEDANCAHLFWAQDSAVNVTRTLPELGAAWADPHGYGVVELFVPDPVRCAKPSVSQ